MKVYESSGKLFCNFNHTKGFKLVSMILPSLLIILAAAAPAGSLSAPISPLTTPGSAVVSPDVLKAAGIADLPPPPPALTITQVPGAQTFLVNVDAKSAQLPVAKLTEEQNALQTMNLANLRSLYDALKTAHDTAVAAASDNDTATKDAQREKDKANKFQAEYDHVKKNTHVNHNELIENLKTAKDNASRLDLVAKNHAADLKTAVANYNTAKTAYSNAMTAASGSIEAFKHAAGL